MKLNLFVFFTLLFFLNGSLFAWSQEYQVDSDRSSVKVLLFKEGIASGLAHNHVIAASEMEGNISLKQNLSQSTFQIVIPAQKLIVDSPKHRQEEGEDFESKLSESDRDDIRETMFSDEVLDTEKYPNIIINQASVAGVFPDLKIKGNITIHGVSKIIELPVILEKQGAYLKIHGEVQLKQSDFGIEPISLFLGTIRVQDIFSVKFDIYGNPISP